MSLSCLPVLPVEAPPDAPPCIACNLGHHPDREHDACGCPCGWTMAARRGAIAVTVRREPVGWAACHGRPATRSCSIVRDE